MQNITLDIWCDYNMRFNAFLIKSGILNLLLNTLITFFQTDFKENKEDKKIYLQPQSV